MELGLLLPGYCHLLDNSIIFRVCQASLQLGAWCSKETGHVEQRYKPLLIYSTTFPSTLVILRKLQLLGLHCLQESSYQVLFRLTMLSSAVSYFVCCSPRDCVWKHCCILSVFFIFSFASSQSGCT